MPLRPVPTVETCDPGAERECGIKLDERQGIVTCYIGTQTCDDGRWSDCRNGSITTKALPASTPAGGFRPLGLTSPVDCEDNPCDPGCRVFEEEPPDPVVTPITGTTYDWEVGSLAGMPNGLVKKGLTEPCETGYDCQFNMYCEAPSAGSCGHGVCEEGEELEDGCSDCVTAVCDQNPLCCVYTPEVDTCEHDPCERGDDMNNGCNSCVSQICAVHPHCCTNGNTWDATCVAAVSTICGNTCECATGTTAFNGRCYQHQTTTRKQSQARTACQGISGSNDWDLVRIDSSAENTHVRTWGNTNNVWIGVYETSTNNIWRWTYNTPSTTWNQSNSTGFYVNWKTGEPGSDQCGIMQSGQAGKWDGTSCNNQYGAVCEGPPERMVKAPEPPHEWSDDCVDLVATACDATCSTSDPSDTTGSCTPWYPGETDPSCTGIDLALGVPCDGVLAVCNHGQTAAPAGIKVVHFPANSMQFPLTNPSLTHPQVKQCTTAEPIPPGECINLTTCPGLTGNREIMVNPGTTGVTECSQQDNWSLFSSGTECGGPICAGGSSEASMIKVPVDIIVSIDNSYSMQGEIQSVQSRIATDLADIIEAADIDYRVIMVTRYGNVYSLNYDSGTATDSAYSVCIGSPMSSLDCPTSSGDTTPAVANTPPNFYHHSTDIGSNNMWCRLLESYSEPDPYPVSRTGWSSVAPNGWGAFLREEAFKVFVAITDDDPLATNATYTHGGSTLDRDCPNMLGNANHDGTNDLAGAQDFDAALRTLAPTQFGAVGGTRNYVWYSIAGMTGAEDDPLTPSDPVETRCCRFDRGADTICQGTLGTATQNAASSGVGYQHLSILTGGLRYPSCYHDSFDVIFNAIADDVIRTASASCDLVPAGTSAFDPDLATVVYTTVVNNGDVTTELTRVANAGACVSNAWYHDDSSGTSTIKLCPTICATVQADTNARVTMELACPSSVEPTTETFVYASVCDADEGGQWMDLGYEGSIPGDGNVIFRVRVAKDEASLVDADWIDLRTATTAQESCALGSGCEIDVFNELGAFDAQFAALELEVTLNPSSTGSAVSLSSWNLTYSCSDNQ